MTDVSEFAKVLDHIAIMSYDINVRTFDVSRQEYIS